MTDKHLYGFNNPCFWSSFLFLTNVIVSYYYDAPIYFALFFALFISSIFLHFTQNECVRIIDKGIIYSIVLYGFYVFLYKCFYTENANWFYIYTIFMTFIATIVLYYSKIADILVNVNGITGHFYHTIVHLVGSIGHNLIVIL
jgi:hypothetical protein